jgi:hypothetical protein
VSVPYHNFFNLTQFVQTPAMLVMLYESPNSPHRTIYTDGRPLPVDPNPAWFGYSVGRWDGDTLVVTTAGFNDRAWLDSAGIPRPNRCASPSASAGATSATWTSRRRSTIRRSSPSPSRSRASASLVARHRHPRGRVRERKGPAPLLAGERA